MTRKVKVGDKLRVTRDNLWGADVKCGDIVVVTRVCHDEILAKCATGEWDFCQEDINNGLEFVDEPQTMTMKSGGVFEFSGDAKDTIKSMTSHQFKVGDKAVWKDTGDECTVVAVIDPAYVTEDFGPLVCLTHIDGEPDSYQYNVKPHELMPPKRRIQGWVAVGKVSDGYHTTRMYNRKKEAIGALESIFDLNAIACIYIDCEEGEWL